MHALTPILAFFNTVDLTDEQRKELNEEAILMASLRHPCICQFYGMAVSLKNFFNNQAKKFFFFFFFFKKKKRMMGVS